MGVGFPKGNGGMQSFPRPVWRLARLRVFSAGPTPLVEMKLAVYPRIIFLIKCLADSEAFRERSVIVRAAHLQRAEGKPLYLKEGAITQIKICTD